MEDGRQTPSTYDHDREPIITALVASKDRIGDFFSADDGKAMGATFSFRDPDDTVTTWTGRDRVLYLANHEVHHRGRITLAMRQWGYLEDFPGP